MIPFRTITLTITADIDGQEGHSTITHISTVDGSLGPNGTDDAATVLGALVAKQRILADTIASVFETHMLLIEVVPIPPK